MSMGLARRNIMDQNAISVMAMGIYRKIARNVELGSKRRVSFWLMYVSNQI